MKKLLIGIAALVMLGTACTPEQISTYERLSGTQVPTHIETPLIEAPDAPFNSPWGIINPDGTVTKYSAPAGSKCPQWYGAAMQAGWSPADWSRIDYIIFRESNCQPGVYNGRGRDSSYGLMQLNMKAHKSWVGPLVGWDFTKLYDPVTNLRIGRKLFSMAVKVYGCGWQPWAFRC